MKATGRFVPIVGARREQLLAALFRAHGIAADALEARWALFEREGSGTIWLTTRGAAELHRRLTDAGAAIDAAGTLLTRELRDGPPLKVQGQALRVLDALVTANVLTLEPERAEAYRAREDVDVRDLLDAGVAGAPTGDGYVLVRGPLGPIGRGFLRRRTLRSELSKAETTRRDAAG